MDDVKTQDDNPAFAELLKEFPPAEPLATRPSEVESPRMAPRNVTPIEGRPRLSLLEHSEEVGELLKALVAATLNFDEIEKDLTAKVKPRDPSKREYEYDYASLAAINRKVRRPLADQGLVIMHGLRPTQNGIIVVRTTLWHVSSQWVRNDLVVGTGPTMDPQIIGTGSSYAKRYNILALLNLSPVDDDDDAATVSAAIQAAQQQQNAPRPAQRKSQQAPAQAANVAVETLNRREAVAPPKNEAAKRLADAAKKKPIGKVADFAVKKDGVAYVALDTGYLAATRDPERTKLLQLAKEKNITIEIVAEAKAGYAPNIVEIIAKDVD